VVQASQPARCGNVPVIRTCRGVRSGACRSAG
jgi:hypothetical protein